MFLIDMNKHKTLSIIFLTAICIISWGCGSGGGKGGSGSGDSNSDNNSTVTSTQEYKLHGINFSPYINGQEPSVSPSISEDQLITLMEIIKPYTKWIRTYGCTNGLEKSGLIAHNLGLKIALGAWLSSDIAENEKEISNLINAAKAGQADILIVGSEVLHRGDLSVNALISYIARVRKEVSGIPIAYADDYSEFIEHTEVINAVDTIFVNYYPFWKGIKVDQSVAILHSWHQQIKAVAEDKDVVVSETGWPSAGGAIGAAVASSENASFYFLNFVSWARENNVAYFYFETFDESWKAAYEGPPGAYWGIWDKGGKLKQGMDSVFKGDKMANNWSCGILPDGSGDPSIEFVSVPPYGSIANLKGKVLHVDPSDYKVAVYINVNGGWWTKPYWSQPLTSIQCDGEWSADITTGGSDQNARIISAYLLPNWFNPPSMSGGSTLPQWLEDNAVAKVSATR